MVTLNKDILVLEEMAIVSFEVIPQQESAAPNWMCPLKNPVLLDLFTEIITDSSSEDTQAFSTTIELQNCRPLQMMEAAP